MRVYQNPSPNSLEVADENHNLNIHWPDGKCCVLSHAFIVCSVCCEQWEFWCFIILCTRKNIWNERKILYLEIILLKIELQCNSLLWDNNFNAVMYFYLLLGPPRKSTNRGFEFKILLMCLEVVHGKAL
jgi:hypothetical protein